jgi:hypothetical protein
VRRKVGIASQQENNGVGMKGLKPGNCLEQKSCLAAAGLPVDQDSMSTVQYIVNRTCWLGTYLMI